MHILMKYQLSSISQKLINPTDPSQITLTYTIFSKISKIFQDILYFLKFLKFFHISKIFYDFFSF